MSTINNNTLQYMDDTYQAIEGCIGEIVKSRLTHDEKREGKAIQQMEMIMVGVQEMLGWILQENQWKGYI